MAPIFMKVVLSVNIVMNLLLSVDLDVLLRNTAMKFGLIHESMSTHVLTL